VEELVDLIKLLGQPYADLYKHGHRAWAVVLACLGVIFALGGGAFLVWWVIEVAYGWAELQRIRPYLIIIGWLVASMICFFPYWLVSLRVVARKLRGKS
jgi:hypothetical protein